MADQRLTDKTAITSIDDADLLHVVDVSDTSGNASGTSKKITWENAKRSIKEEEILGTATYDGAVTGATNIDLDNDACSRLILTGNTTITFTNTPASGESVVRSYLIKSTTTQTLGFANSDNEYGTYAADGTENKVIVEASNYPTAGLIIDVIIQPAN